MMNSEVEEDGDSYTLDEALSEVGFGKFQYLVLVYAGLGAIAEAMEVMILSFVGPSVKSEWGLSSGQESLITTVVFAGMLIGSYSWGVLSDKYGRRKGLMSVAMVTAVSSVLSALSPNYIWLVTLRTLVGIGLGGGPVYTSWFLEFVPPNNRGFWMVVFSTFWTAGTIFEASLAWIVMPRLGWRWLLAVSSIPCLAALLFYGLTVESPRYSYINGRTNEAHDILKKMAKVNRKELPSGDLVGEKTTDPNASLEDEPLFSPGKNRSTFSKDGFSTVKMLFSPGLVKTTILLWVVYFGNSFSYYGIILLTSEMSSEQSKCGLITLHVQGSSDTGLYRDVFITSLAELPGLILSAILVDRVGRKFSMAIMYALGFVFLLPLIFHQQELLSTAVLFGARMCIIGTFTVAGVYCPEVYPTSARTTGVGVASSVGRVAGMICPIIAVGLMANCHQMVAIILFEVVIVLSGCAVLLFAVETNGRKLSDIVPA